MPERRPRRGSPTRRWKKIAGRIVTAIPEVVSVTYNITTKPPSTIEAI